MSTILLKRSNTAANDSYKGYLGEITIDTQARKIRIHDGALLGGHVVANMTDITNLLNTIDGLEVEDIGGLLDVLDTLVVKDTEIIAGDGLTGGGDLSGNRTITLGTPDTITASTTNTVTATGHTHQININKADLNLGNVDNTSDADKPVSTATQNELNLKIDLTEKGESLGVVPLNANRKIDNEFISDSILGQVEYMGLWDGSINDPNLPIIPDNKGSYYVVSVAGSYAGLTFEVGDWIISNGIEWQKVDNTDAVSTVAGKTGNVVLDRSDVGLPNVNNTSDADKPVSTDTQTELNKKANINSPTLTGVPLAPTPLVGDNSKKIATTEYVKGELNLLYTGVSSVSGTGAIEVNNSDTANPIVGIKNATTVADGAMSVADKVKLNNIETGAQVNVVTKVAGKTGDVELVKSDVGLGNVDNYATASKVQAVEGESTTKFVTPKRVREFIEEGTYTIDGGTF